jgi:hypothetical protein
LLIIFNLNNLLKQDKETEEEGEVICSGAKVALPELGPRFIFLNWP